MRIVLLLICLFCFTLAFLSSSVVSFFSIAFSHTHMGMDVWFLSSFSLVCTWFFEKSAVKPIQMVQYINKTSALTEVYGKKETKNPPQTTSKTKLIENKANTWMIIVLIVWYISFYVSLSLPVYLMNVRSLTHALIRAGQTDRQQNVMKSNEICIKIDGTFSLLSHSSFVIPFLVMHFFTHSHMIQHEGVVEKNVTYFLRWKWSTLTEFRSIYARLIQSESTNSSVYL